MRRKITSDQQYQYKYKTVAWFLGVLVFWKEILGPGNKFHQIGCIQIKTTLENYLEIYREKFHWNDGSKKQKQ